MQVIRNPAGHVETVDEEERDGPSLKGICEKWDLWQMFFDLPKENQKFRTVLAPELDSKELVQWGKVMAAPLYEITKIANVDAMMKQVREAGASGKA